RDTGFAARMQPDVVLRVGAPPTNKPLGAWLRPEVGQVFVDPDGTWLDPQHAVSGRMLADPELLLSALTERLSAPDPSWSDEWRAVDDRARAVIDELLDRWAEPFEGRIARDVVAALPAGAAFVVASSMPVRDVESFAAARDDVRFHSNRGVNGID